MVWKSDFFSGFMRFVRVPPYENWAFWTNFYFSWENGDISFSRKSCNLFHTKNEEKSQKISTRIRIPTCVYANTWQGGLIRPPPPWIGLIGKGRTKKREKLTSVSFMYVCVAENAELLVFFYFFLHIPHRQFTLPHPSPNCHQSQKLEFCSYFCPKKCPSFVCTFTNLSLSEGFCTLLFQTFLWTLPSDSYWLMLPPHMGGKI